MSKSSKPSWTVFNVSALTNVFRKSVVSWTNEDRKEGKLIKRNSKGHFKGSESFKVV